MVDDATISFDRVGTDLTVTIVGELDVASAPEFSEQISSATRPDDSTLWLDLSAVPFCASAGVSLIAGAEREANERGGRMVLLRPSDPVPRILEQCNLAGHLKIRDA